MSIILGSHLSHIILVMHRIRLYIRFSRPWLNLVPLVRFVGVVKTRRYKKLSVEILCSVLYNRCIVAEMFEMITYDYWEEIILNITDKMLLKIKQSIRIMKIIILSVFISLLFTSCSPKSIDIGIRQTPTLSIDSMSALQPFETSTAPTQTTTSIMREKTSHGNELFEPIINAYAELERSGYTSFDKNIIGDSLLAVSEGSTYNYGTDTKPTLMYTFYDINSDGSQELFIGANESISGIYVLQNGSPVSIIQVESRHNLSLLKDSDDNNVIEDSWGHMGYATNFFYTIDEEGKLVTLDKLFTNGDDKKDGEFIGHFRAKDALGKEVSITEKEYCSLIQKYGSDGYEPFENIGGEAGKVDVLWKAVATYNATP